MNNKFFALNKLEDWERGFKHDVNIDADGRLYPVYGAANGMGFFISHSFDTLTNGTAWHRLLLVFETPENCSVKVSCFASDSFVDIFDGEERKIDDFLLDEAISAGDKLTYMRRLCDDKLYVNVSDALINDMRGRYMWIKLELTSYDEYLPVLEKIRLYFDIKPMVDYLPEIYRIEKNGGDFLNRYIGIFQSLYLDMERQIDNIAMYFDPDYAGGDFLQWLSGWVMVEDPYMWDEDKLRYLIKHAVELYKLRGTRAGVAEAVKLYTGQAPYIIENFEAVDPELGEVREELMKDLYGENPYMFTVLVNNESIRDQREYAELLKIIENNKPANTQVNLVVLEPSIYIDRQTYAGINSYLADAAPIALDSRTPLLHNRLL